MERLLNKSPNILVVGDLMIDHYLWGKCEKISPEAPVQIVEIEKETKTLGGAGNVINNLIALGARVDVISVIGDDLVALEMKEMLSNIGVNINQLITQKKRITTKKTRIIAFKQQVIRFDKETKVDIDYNTEKKVIKKFKENLLKYDLILFSDYGKGLFTKKLTQELIKAANLNNIKILVDPKGADYRKYKGAFLLTPNKKEAIEATKLEFSNNASLSEVILKLKEICNLEVSLITLSEGGIAVYDYKLVIYPTVAREVYDVTGAGDTVLASLGFSIACEYNVHDAVQFANLAAGVVVGKIGSAVATLKEIINYEASFQNKALAKSKVKTFQEIEDIVKKLKSIGKKIVFTNGCFDILHVGHIKLLEEAKDFGDILIIGLNSDHSIKRIKGQDRPINNEVDRAHILTTIEYIDYVVIFEDDTPYSLIKIIKPNILVKGKDYEGQEVIGQDIADELRLINIVEGKSTSNIIKKVKCQN
ncbi:MAG: D-glycero-beta-D-manno-heptose-7-phosphate kinase [Flavobacteriaceae bacterium]|nr:D-glycero-beta-D-manno-heptose-7-phosphate kinase [Flavobacteriaceae bacterium]